MGATLPTVALADVLIGASLALLLVRLRPQWFEPARASSVTERLQEIRGKLVAALRDLSREDRKSPPPIRMGCGRDPERIEDRRAARELG